MPPWLPSALGIAADVTAVVSFPMLAVPIVLIAGAVYVARHPPAEGGFRGVWERLAYRKTVVTMLSVAAIAYAIDIAERFVYRAKEFDPDQKLEDVYAQTFKNKHVYLDGYRFVECTFENVTLIYKGTAPFSLVNAHYPPGTTINFGSTSPAVDMAIIGHSTFLQQGSSASYRWVHRNELKQ